MYTNAFQAPAASWAAISSLAARYPCTPGLIFQLKTKYSTPGRFIRFMLNAVALILHLIAINVWVGGTFFAIVILSRALRDIGTSQQLTLWQLVFRHFFAWTWLAVFILLSSGTWLVYGVYGGFDTIPIYIMLMGILAVLMIANYIFIYFVPYRQFRQLLRVDDIDSCLRKLAVIRFAGIINMMLGLCIVVIIGSGPYLL